MEGDCQMIFPFDTSFQERKVLSGCAGVSTLQVIARSGQPFWLPRRPTNASVVINQIHTLGSNSFYLQDYKELA